MRFAFIARHRNIWPVAWLCSALDVSRSGFHACLNRSPSVRSQHDEVLISRIGRSFKSSDRTYGSRRVWHDVLAEGAFLRPASYRAAHAGERAACPAAASWAAEGHRRASGSIEQPPRPRLRGIGTEPEMGRRLHYVWTAEGWLYVAAVVDLFSHRVVGWR